MTDHYLHQISQRLLEFARARDWEQFHAPKNLAMALAVEAGEIMEHFQWLSEEQSEQLSEDKRQQVAYEIADVFIFTMRLTQRLGILQIRCVVAPKNIPNTKKGRDLRLAWINSPGVGVGSPAFA